MGWIVLLFLFAGIFIGIWGVIKEGEHIFFVVLSTFGSLTLAVIACFMILIVIEINFESDYVEYKTVKIHAFNNANEITGSFGGGFLLQSGSVENEMFYHYIAESEMGGKTIFKVSVKSASVVETQEFPKAIFYKKEFLNPTIQKHFGMSSKQFVKFYVPENTIKESFNMSI